MSDEPKPDAGVSHGMNINTMLTLPVVKAVGAAVALLTAGWFAKDYASNLTRSVTDLAREVGSLRVELKLELDRRTFDRWTRTEQKMWSYELERLNAGKIVTPQLDRIP